jgi:hypothetical protein
MNPFTLHPRRLLSTAGLLLALLSLASQTLPAQRMYFFGALGRQPIAGWLDRDTNHVSGWYFHTNEARQIRIEGDIGSDGYFQLEETMNPGGRAAFLGSVMKGTWMGMWKAGPGETSAPFSFEEFRNPPTELSCAYHCSARIRDYELGTLYSWTLTLSINRGRVRKFLSVQGSRMLTGEEQQCSMSMDDMRQRPSRTGILLVVGDGESKEDSVPACSIRILANKEFVWVRFEDAPDAGHDCRNIGETMYCSPRAFWNDLLIDRRTGKCRPVN